jgi:serine/threonine protein kinase
MRILQMFQVYATTRYERLEQIGVGEGMNSTVFRAFDPYLKREIAVKEIPMVKLGNDFDAYCHEARTMFAVADPNIVQIEYVCEIPGDICLALPYFPKGSLTSLIANGPLGLKQFVKTAHGILAGVARIHGKHLLHLDLKPSNIFVDGLDNPLIGDFGQARRLAVDGTVKFPTVYRWSMPPEVWDSHVAIVESDVYQLGVLMYRIVNGEPIYHLQKLSISSDAQLQDRICRGRFPDPRFFLPHVPKRIRSIIRKALKPKPSERYHSVSELASALGKVHLPLNWTTNYVGAGAYTWRAIRPGSPDLEVELRSKISGWQTCVWTARGKERRAKGTSDYWREQLSHAQACDHLTEVFADLSQ